MALLLGLLGFAGVVQVRTQATDTDYAGAPRGDLVQLLDSLDLADQRARDQVAQLQRTRAGLLTSSAREQTARAARKREASMLALLDGTVAVQGPGVQIRIDDPRHAVTSATILNAIEELRDAGAEAIQINGEVRVVARTYVSDGAKGRIEADGRLLSPPYQLAVIGSSHDLARAVSFPGGLTAQVEALGGSVSASAQRRIVIRSLAAPSSDQYAQPAH